MGDAGATARMPAGAYRIPAAESSVEDGVEWIVSREPVPYQTALRFMDARAGAIRQGGAAECVWLLEHPPLYTAGTSADDAELLDHRSLPVYRSGRGGRYTYHGPGQRVAYVMLDLVPRGSDLRRYVWGLEEWVILALAEFGVDGRRRRERIGVWIETSGGEAKVAALGVRVRRWVSMHGIALNIDPDLAAFQGIVPCGIRDHGVTSLRALGIPATTEMVDVALRRTFPGALGRQRTDPVPDVRR